MTVQHWKPFTACHPLSLQISCHSPAVLSLQALKSPKNPSKQRVRWWNKKLTLNVSMSSPINRNNSWTVSDLHCGALIITVPGVRRALHQGTDTNSSGIYGPVNPEREKKTQGQTPSQLPLVAMWRTICCELTESSRKTTVPLLVHS